MEGGGVPSSVSGRGELSVPAVGEEFCRNKRGIYHHSAEMEGEDGEIRMGVMEKEGVGGGQREEVVTCRGAK